jgi:hypothetical protein
VNRKQALKLIREILKEATPAERQEVKQTLRNISAGLPATSTETKQLLNEVSEAEAG